MKIQINTILISIGLISIGMLSNLVLADLVKSQPALDCNKVFPNDVIVTSQGAEPVGKYCDFQEKLPQVFINDRVESQPVTSLRSKFGNPYTEKGNVCRDRGIDTICLTPSNASKLNGLK